MLFLQPIAMLSISIPIFLLDGSDYLQPENTTIVLSAGAHGMMFEHSVTIIDDSLFENEEIFVLALSADDPTIVVFNESEAQVVIQDDDNGTTVCLCVCECVHERQQCVHARVRGQRVGVDLPLVKYKHANFASHETGTKTLFVFTVATVLNSQLYTDCSKSSTRSLSQHQM